MNRFRHKKKDKEESSASAEQSSMPSFRDFLRGRKAPEEKPDPKPETTPELPSHDEFRTSLLMTSLSARFSMLREQDDPNTKIGKASDDSVLQPKRQSRLMDYGFTGGLATGGLNDIAEVESIKAPFTRIDSFVTADDSASMKGSIMSRGKPTDGNNLFGGRQKIVVGSRTLYESDVATSSFQKWRREERERERLAQEEEEAKPTSPERRPRPSYDESFVRPDSGSLGYQRYRETSSTTASSMARNSTAATSIASQQSQATSASERSVFRTRRLYEQGLNQDLHDHQSTALSRIDTLAGKRTISSRSPDLNSASSPTVGFGFSDRRILSKASAPNLRTTTSPPATATTGNTDRGSNASNIAESRFNFPGTPPLSPPISEGGDMAVMTIQPNDVGKATALGVFQKPAQPYNESQYAQRQLQLQQGRDTPTLRDHTEPSPTERSRAELSIQTLTKDQGFSSMTFFDDSEASPLPMDPPPQIPLPRIPAASRPSDSEHPAFRQDALPTPMSFTSKVSEASPIFDQNEVFESPVIPQSATLMDSPVLGNSSLGLPSGLGGLVRQHMRTESSASSIYAGPQSGDVEKTFPVNTRESTVLGSFGGIKDNWQDQQWNPYGDEGPVDVPQDREIKSKMASEDSTTTRLPTMETASSGLSANMDKDDNDDFANQLANAKRRVHERLTSSYSESAESSRAPSPAPEPMPTPRSNPFGILRGKSSRGSLRDAMQKKPIQTLGLGLGASTMSSSPSPSRQSFGDTGIPSYGDVGLPPMMEEPEVNYGTEPESRPSRQREREMDHDNTTQDKEAEGDNVHPGLRAFRNARRELQKRKELETLARHQPHGQDGEERRSESNDGPRDQSLIRPYRPQRDRSADSYLSAASRSPPRSERDRSGSEASNGRAPIRPGRMRNTSSPFDSQGQGPLSVNTSGAAGPRQPMTRSPGLPGTDIRRSPYMPPQASPRAPQTGFERPQASGNLTVKHSREPMSPQMSPGLPSSPRRAPGPPISANPPSAPTTTNSTLNGSLKKAISKRDISDPTFVMSTSRVPTVSLPQSNSSPDNSTMAFGGSDQRSPSASKGPAPPLPPLNPLRSRGATNGFGRDSEDTATFPNQPGPVGSDDRNASPAGEEQKPASRWRLRRKPSAEGNGISAKINAFNSGGGFLSSRDTRSFATAAPPVGRSVMTPSTKSSSSNRDMPGGMI